jgi:hypothetical protein
MRELRGGVPPKIADTTGTVIDGLGKFLGSDPLLIPNPFPVCPILAEKTVKGASVIKHSKVFVPIFWVPCICEMRIAGTRATGTDPIGYTIRGKPIIIPAHIPLL